MSSSTFVLRVVLFGASLLMPATVIVAAPGPDETAEDQTYDVRLKSRDSDSYSGQAVFDGDPDRPQDLESGDLMLNLSSDDESQATVAAEGTWWSWNFGWLSFWFAVADTQTEGQLFAFGLAAGDSLFGKAGVVGNAEIPDGRYFLRGKVSEEEPPGDEPPGEEPPEEPQPGNPAGEQPEGA